MFNKFQQPAAPAYHVCLPTTRRPQQKKQRLCVCDGVVGDFGIEDDFPEFYSSIFLWPGFGCSIWTTARLGSSNVGSTRIRVGLTNKGWCVR